MTFQAVSVGQKLASDNKDGTCADDTGSLKMKPGGYKDGTGNPTEVLAYGLDKTDRPPGSMIKALKEQRLYESTLFIVSAKHGQSPINPLKTNKPGHFADLVFGLDNNDPVGIIINDAGNNCSTGPCGFVQDDDIALIWLPDQTKTADVAAYLNANANALSIDEVMAGRPVKHKIKQPPK